MESSAEVLEAEIKQSHYPKTTCWNGWNGWNGWQAGWPAVVSSTAIPILLPWCIILLAFYDDRISTSKLKVAFRKENAFGVFRGLNPIGYGIGYSYMEDGREF